MKNKMLSLFIVASTIMGCAAFEHNGKQFTPTSLAFFIVGIVVLIGGKGTFWVFLLGAVLILIG